MKINMTFHGAYSFVPAFDAEQSWIAAGLAGEYLFDNLAISVEGDLADVLAMYDIEGEDAAEEIDNQFIGLSEYVNEQLRAAGLGGSED